jgi:hypothetical protein
MNENTKALTLAILACSQFLGACAFQPISPTPDAIRASIDPGDTVRVIMQNGQEHTIQVIEIGSEGFSGDKFNGEPENFTYREIAQLEKREVNKTVVWTVLIIGGAAILSSGR